MKKHLPLILAHRANINGPAPVTENTSAAIRKAFAVPGLDGIELDVDMTSDGILVLNHRDPQLAPPTTTLDFQSLLKKYHNRLIPRLDEGLKLLRSLLDEQSAQKKFIINLEIKRDREAVSRYPPDYIERILKELQESLKPTEFILTSFDPHVLQKIKELQPIIPTGLIVHKNAEDAVIHAAILKARPDFLVPNATLLRKNSDAGKIITGFEKVYVWTVDTEQEMNFFLTDHRVSGIITNYPHQAIALCAEIQLRRKRKGP